jgi:hypothetical protein
LLSIAILKIKKEIAIEAKESNGYFCQGCLDPRKAVTNSHILSIAQRPDLATDKRNICLFCIDCHQDWESNDPERMIKPTFLKDMKYIYEKDQSRFHDILFKLIDYKGKNGIVKIMLGKIERLNVLAE